MHLEFSGACAHCVEKFYVLILAKAVVGYQLGEFTLDYKIGKNL